MFIVIVFDDADTPAASGSSLDDDADTPAASGSSLDASAWFGLWSSLA